MRASSATWVRSFSTGATPSILTLRFTFATFKRAGEIRGFLVFEEHTLEGTCSIYDLVGASAEDLRAMLALLILRGLETPGLVTIRGTP